MERLSDSRCQKESFFLIFRESYHFIPHMAIFSGNVKTFSAKTARGTHDQTNRQRIDFDKASSKICFEIMLSLDLAEFSFTFDCLLK